MQPEFNYSFNVSFLYFHSAHRTLQNLIAGYLLETFLAGLVDSSRLLSGYSFCRNFLQLTRYLSVIQKNWVLKRSTSGRTEIKAEVWKGKQFPSVPLECFFLVDPTCQ